MITKAAIELESGVTVYVTPVTLLVQRALLARAEDAHPEPDVTPYKRVIEDALVEGQMTDGTDDPEYKRLLREALERRSQTYLGYLLDVAVDLDDRDAIVAQHKPMIERLRASFEGMPIYYAMTTDFVVVLVSVLVHREDEVRLLVRLAQRALPLSEGEIRDGLAFFRSMAVRKSDVRRSTARKVASDIPQGESTS